MKTLDRNRFAAPGLGRPRAAGFRAAAAVAAGSLLLASAGVAYADDVYNTLDGNIDTVAEVMPLNVGGPNGTTKLALDPTNDDGNKGCNLPGHTILTLNLNSSQPSVATVSPSTVTFTSCGFEQPLTVTPISAGSTNITASLAGSNADGTFNLKPAAFTVNVTAPAPANAAPVLTITGTAIGGSYPKGSVPATVCNVTDKEDGPSSFDAIVGDITGIDAATGIGSQTASCSYEDKGGLKTSGSVTYNIVDGSAPKIGYTLSPAAPDGLGGWYRSAVKLTWTVTEPDSPSTLQTLEGCVDQLIVDDQFATAYSCAASSGGGIATWETESIKKDGTKPTVSNAIGATGTVGKNGWFTSNVEAFFTATDATAGLLTAAKSAFSAGQGADVSVQSPVFADIAGNSTEAGAVSQSFDIDWTAPEVTYVGVSPTNPNENGWYKADVVATFAGVDLISGLASPATLTATSTGEGNDVVVESPVFEDVAGNVSAVGAATSDGFKIDKTAPTASFDSAMADVYYGTTPVFPTCTASDGLSGPQSCVVTGGGPAVGTQTLTATATDLAGNTATATQTYTVKPWTLKGFYQPIDMGGILNTVKGGSTVPAKFEVFAGDKELTDPSLLSFSVVAIQCTSQFTDDVEVIATGNTSLRYDTTAGQFVYNWKTPTGAGKCYQLVMTAADGNSISANFKLK